MSDTFINSWHGHSKQTLPTRNQSGYTPSAVATDLSQAIECSPRCGVAVSANTGGHAAIRSGWQ
jgi:hypothetical protein